MIEKKYLQSAICNAAERSTQIRHDLHAHPELSGQEKETAGRIMAELDALGILYRSNVYGHGIYALIEGQDKNNAIALRTEMDALPIFEQTNIPCISQIPGVMHACGHDVHMAAVLGAARVLNEMKDKLPKSVVLLFEPMEETEGGADGLIGAGCLEDPHVTDIIASHIYPIYDSDKIIFIPGVMNAACCEFSVTVKGKSCHGAYPHLGFDPLVCACAMVTSLQSIITRRIHPAESALITVGKFNSGTAINVIPDTTTFAGTIRVLEMKNRPFIKDEIRRICEGTAAAYGCDCEITFNDGYPTLENNPELFAILSEDFKERFGEEHVVIAPNPTLGADSFACFCHAARAFLIYIGSKIPGSEPGSLHAANLYVDEHCITTAIEAEVYGALKLMGVEVEK